MKNNTQKYTLLFAATAFCAAMLLAFFLYTGVIFFNYPSKNTYPVRGVDVSHHQGDIDWEILSKQNIQFAYIKGTEGGNFIDKKFLKNFSAAHKTNLRVGAYHFFSYDSSGESQYRNFISIVPMQKGMLPPVVDIEFYGDKQVHLPDKEKTQRELKILLQLLEEHYHLKPVIYTTGRVYELYIAEDFSEYDIWIRNVFRSPALADGRDWAFWQYTNRERLAGYAGREKFIDMNVFNGSAREFAAYPAKPGARP